VLKGGPQPARAIWAEAQKQGLSERTLKRGKRELAIRSQRVVREGRQETYWLLPDQQLPAGVEEPGGPADLEPWLAPLRAMYPPSTPLDED